MRHHAVPSLQTEEPVAVVSTLMYSQSMLFSTCEAVEPVLHQTQVGRVHMCAVQAERWVQLNRQGVTAAAHLHADVCRHSGRKQLVEEV
jgi:hypothetical protein